MMDKRMAEALDRHITGNYGEDQFMGYCPNCNRRVDMTEERCEYCGYKFTEND